jgi:Cupin superfamily protein
MADGDRLRAAAFTGTLWAAAWCAGRTWPRHYPAAYDARWLAGLPLPGAGRALVTLLEPGRKELERHPDGPALEAACATRVRMDIGWHAPGAWYGLAASHLGRLAGEDGPAVCSVYTSRGGDASLGMHGDAWHGLIVQMTGAKRWLLGHGREPVTTTAGDILILPKYVLHEAATPADPGHSVHLVFAISRNPPPGP